MSCWIIEKDSISEFPEHRELIDVLVAQRKEFHYTNEAFQHKDSDILRGTVEFVLEMRGPHYFDNLRFSSYAGPLFKFLVNKNFSLEPFGIIKKHPKDMPRFIRPNESDKKFDGGVYNLKEFVTSHHQILGDDELIVTAHQQEIRAECRFIVINNQVEAGTMYKPEQKRWDESFEPAMVIANEFKSYNKMKAYTMDLCIADEGIWQLVELNSFESSGLYECNLSRIVSEIR
jgi:hypothetical protein